MFGNCHKLEPLPVEKKIMWQREMDCLLSVCEYIVELFPSSHSLPDGTKLEVGAQSEYYFLEKLYISDFVVCHFFFLTYMFMVLGDGNKTEI